MHIAIFYAFTGGNQCPTDLPVCVCCAVLTRVKQINKPVNIHVFSLCDTVRQFDDHQDQLLSSVPCHATCQAAQPRRRYSHTALDLRQVFSGT